MEKSITLDELLNLIEEKKVKDIREIFETIPTIDIAEVCDQIDDIKKLVFIFKTVKSEYTAELFTDLSSEKKEELIKTMSDAELVNLLDDQFTDDIVDFIEDLPANMVNRILRNVDKTKRNDINRLLNYKENTAGSIMTTEYLDLKQNMTVNESIERIRKIGREKETVYTLFVRDERRHLVGTLGLDILVFAKGNEIISDIMERDFVTVNVNTDQEEVAGLFKRYDLHAIAVTNDDECLTGIITIDDAVDVIEQEATEDISKMALVSPMEDSYLKTSVFKMSIKSAPWLVCLMILGVFTSLILSSAQNALAALPVLTVFIPTLMDTGGNASGQSITLIVRGLAVGELKTKDFLKILWKEIRVGFLAGLFVSVIGFAWFLIEMYIGIVSYPDAEILATATGLEIFTMRATIAGIVSITMLVAVILARIIGCCFTLFIKLIHLDPALISSPFVTTIIDICSLLIYFGICVYIFNLVAI